MFFDKNHPHHVGVPDLFPEKSLYKNAMLFLAMGITTKQLLELNNNTLDERGLWNLVNGIADEVQAKRVSLETVYSVQGRDDADKECLSITGIGRNFKKLKAKLESNVPIPVSYNFLDVAAYRFGYDIYIEDSKDRYKISNEISNFNLVSSILS